MRILLIVVFVLAALATYVRVAFAEDNNLSWSDPTMNEDGSPLTDLDHIKVYHSLNGGAPSVIAQVPAGVEGYLHANQTDGEHCYHVTAVRTEGQESLPSNEACKTVDTLLPGSPFGLSVN